MMRTKTCGEIRAGNVDETVKLAGWVQRTRDLGGLLFIDLRDRYGLVQIFIDPVRQKNLADMARKISRESVISVTGTVRPRPANMVNRDMPTGEVEVSPSEIHILSKCSELPIPFEEIIDAGEDLRLQYRYLELRRPYMQKRLEKRHKLAMTVREHLNSRGFWEIETPFFMRSTPEGARDFLVPSRIHQGSFYALPQSPQTYKQILMVAGMDKYFQIVRCFRDEDFRADRQPEFTQIDMEMSFVDEEDVFAEVEELMAQIFRKVIDSSDFEKKFPRMTYSEAMNVYGTDKPDIRFDWKLKNVTEKVRNCGFKVFDAAVDSDGSVFCLPLDGIELSRKQIDEVNDIALSLGLPGVVASKWNGNEFSSPISRFFSGNRAEELAKIIFEGKTGTILFAAGTEIATKTALGELRLKLAEKFEIEKKSGFHCLWVTEFPLFEVDEEGGITSSHHPFTAPREKDKSDLDKNPFSVCSKAYDLVINGVEIASGSIRIHERKLQEKIFSLLGISEDEAQRKFGFLLKAFEYGVPPHGGVAFGFDRLLMLLCGASSIREIIPFPKTTSGLSLMDGSPAKVSEQQLEELGLKIRSMKD